MPGAAGLTEAIAEARATLSATRIKGPRYFVLTALAGYLWTALSTCDTLLVVIESGVGRGAGPLKRVLHECYLDAMFIASDPDPDSLAARSYLSQYRDTRALLSEYRQVLIAHPNSNLPPAPPDVAFFDRPVPEVIKELNEANAAHGGGADLFTRAWDWWEWAERRRIWHWSGLGRKKMVDALIERGKLDGRTAFIALSLTRMYNAAAHAGPPWGELPPTPDGRTEPPGLRSSDAELGQLALSGQQLLGGLSKEVKTFFDLNTSPDRVARGIRPSTS